MNNQYKLPPNPQHAIAKHIYPWEEYNITMILQWLYEQAKKTGFVGTFEDFKQRYGAYVASSDPQDIYDLIENYTGTYHITPLVSIEQVLKTKNKVLNQDIIIDPIPDNLLDTHKTYSGNYQITPLAYVDQVLRTEERIMEENVIIEKIPMHQVDNDAGGRTVTIG